MQAFVVAEIVAQSPEEETVLPNSMTMTTNFRLNLPARNLTIPFAAVVPSSASNIDSARQVMPVAVHLGHYSSLNSSIWTADGSRVALKNSSNRTVMALQCVDSCLHSMAPMRVSTTVTSLCLSVHIECYYSSLDQN